MPEYRCGVPSPRTTRSPPCADLTRIGSGPDVPETTRAVPVPHGFARVSMPLTVTSTVTGELAAPSLSCTVAVATNEPRASYACVSDVPVDPSPQSTVQVSPAAVSAAEGSVAVIGKVTATPFDASAAAGPAASGTVLATARVLWS